MKMLQQKVSAVRAAVTTAFSCLLIISIAMVADDASATSMATGSHGEVLSANVTSGIKAGQAINVTGKGFDPMVGIYVEVCQVVPSGVRPSVCGGGANMSGSGSASFWISSHPPSYGKGLAIALKKGGKFSVVLKVQPKIGSVDCRTAKCAIYIRADHLRTQDRSHDIKLPLTFAH
jgi:hypothetical protein